MAISRTMILLLASAISCLAYSQSWGIAGYYPMPIALGSCVPYNGYAYCVGGWTANSMGGNYAIVNSSYYASLGEGVTGTWLETTGYPENVSGESCGAYQGYLYCIGGGPGLERPLNLSYYAAIGSNGIGKWIQTTSYPTNSTFQSCSIYNGTIYCIGGYGATKAVAYSAKVSPAGIGHWSSITPYPSYVVNGDCEASDGYLYCVGGISNESASNLTYYAKIGNGSIGNWQSGTPYLPDIYGTSCIAYNDTLYCIAGSQGTGFKSAYDTVAIGYSSYTRIGPYGIGNWTQFASYPAHVSGESCIYYNETIYCIGGWDGLSVTPLVSYYSFSGTQASSSYANTTTSTLQPTSTIYAHAKQISVPYDATSLSQAGRSGGTSNILFMAALVIIALLSAVALRILGSRKGNPSVKSGKGK